MIFSEKKVRVRVAGVLLENDTILLIAHKKDGEIYWLLPGGGVNYGESLEDALKREFIEELHIDIEIGEIALVFDSIDPSGTKHIVNICFYCVKKGGVLALGTEKRLYDYGFIEKEQIPQIAMYPPINQELISIMKMERLAPNKKEIYKGKIWSEK